MRWWRWLEVASQPGGGPGAVRWRWNWWGRGAGDLVQGVPNHRLQEVQEQLTLVVVAVEEYRIVRMEVAGGSGIVIIRYKFQ
jgi:hypothetical protein